MRTHLEIAALRRNAVAYQPFSAPATLDWCGRYDSAHAQLEASASEVLRRAYKAVEATADGESKRVLVELQRRVRATKSIARLPLRPLGLAEVDDAAGCYQAALDAVAALEGDLATTIEDTYRGERARLAAVLSRPEFADAAAMTSASQFIGIANYVTGPGATKKARKTEPRLLDLAYRAMLRTTPFGRLTTVGLHRHAEAAPSLWDDDGAEVTRVVHLDYLQQYTLQSRERPGDLLRLTHSASRVPDSGVVRYVVADLDGGSKRVHLPETGFVRALIGLTELGPLRRADIVARLAATLAVPDAKVESAVDGCVRNGLLVACPDAFAPYNSLHADCAAALPFREIAAATGADRRARIAAAEQHIAERAAALATPLQVAVFEDSIGAATDRDLRATTAGIEGLREGLGLCAVYDRNLDLRLISAAVVRGLLADGDRAPLLSIARSVVENTYSTYQLILERNPRPRDVRKLVPGEHYLDLLEFRRGMDAQFAARIDADPDAGEVHFRPAEAGALLAARPGSLGGLFDHSYAVYLQQSGDRYVLNDAYAGNGSMMARFAHPEIPGHSAVLDTMRANIAAWDAPVRQVGDLHGMSVNQCPALVPDPMTALDWSRLMVRADPDGPGLLFEDADRRPVVPMSFGAGMPERFPYPNRLIAWQFLGGRLLRTPMSARHRRLADRTDGAAGIAPAPRLTVGDVTLARRRWYGLPELLARLGAGPHAATFAAFRRARREFGLPEQFFVKRDPLVIDRADRAPKPVFLDTRSVMSVMSAARRLGEPGRFTHIEECLPLPDPGARVCEAVVNEDIA
ncbi:lantibiotic dehydratase [Nocardia nova]|uniref:lantibiotic dehydratase n=1 Tax=Nocardia nova TaxID=37330 RepID=UPI003409F19C